MESVSKTLCCFFTFIYIFNIIISTVDGLKCYQCNSNVDVHCTEQFDNENANIYPSECNVYGAKHCVKTTGMYKGEVGTQRFCSSVGWGDVCEFVQRKGDFREYRSCVYTCSGDECNNSPTIGKSVTLVFILTFIIVALL